MSASRRGRSKDDYTMNKGRQESAVGARDDGGDSTSLSPASRVLAMADQLAEEELRDKAGGDGGGSSGIYSTSEDGSSDGSLVFRSKRETCGPREPATGANQREKRRGYIQQRRGRHEKSSTRRTYHPLGLASPAASRASSDDSWRQEILKDRKNSPADRTRHEDEREEGSLTCKAGKASEATTLVDGDLEEVGDAGINEDDVERMSLAGLKTAALELGLPINGRKQQLKVRIKERLRSMSVPRCAAVAVDPASPVETSAEPGIAPVDLVKTPPACAHECEDPRIEEESPLLADTTTVSPRGEGSEETARLTSESTELALGEAELARVNNADVAKAVPATISEESPPASPLSLLEEGAAVPREKPELPADEASTPRRERQRGDDLEGEHEGGAAAVLKDSRATEIEGGGGDRTDSGEGMGEGFPVGVRSPRGEPRVEAAAPITEADSEVCDERGRELQEAEGINAGARGCRPQTENATVVGEKPVGGSAALAGGRLSPNPEREGSDSEDSANVEEVLASGLRRAAGDSSVLFESGGRGLEGEMEEVTTVEAQGRRVPGRERREEESGVRLGEDTLRSLEDTGRDSHGSNEQQLRGGVLLAGDSQGTTRELATKDVMKYKRLMERVFGKRRRTPLAGILEGSTADVKAASTMARSLGKPFHRNRGARGEPDPGVPRRALEGRNWRAIEVEDPPPAEELEAKFRALERMCAPYLSGGKSSPSPGHTLLPETKGHKKNVRRLAVWLDAHANARGSRDGCASRTWNSSGARKIPAAVPLARGDRPATLEKGSKPSRIDVGGGDLTRAERTKDDAKRGVPAGSAVAAGSVRAPRSSSSSTARVPQPRPAASSAAGAGGSTRLLRGGNRPNDHVREAHASPTASKTRTHFRGGLPAAATSAAALRRLTKSGGHRSSTASRLGPPPLRRNPLTHDSTSPRPPRVSVSRSGIGKMGAAAVSGRRSSTASRRGSTAVRGDVKGGQGRRDSKGDAATTPPRIQRHRRNQGTGHVARSRKPSLSLAEPRPSKISSGLATTSKLPRPDGTGDFLGRRQSVKGRGSVTPPRQGARGANGVATPRSGKNRSALQVFGIDTSMPTPPRIGQRLRNASVVTKTPVGGRSAPPGDAKK